MRSVSDPIFKKLRDLASEKPFTYTFFTGDLINYEEFITFLNIITEKDVIRVLGNMDSYFGANLHVSKFRTVEFTISKGKETLTIGLTHGSQLSPRGDHYQLENIALENNCIILISGHTHKEDIHLTDKGILLLNPGSITGAWSFVASKIPSFMTLIVDVNNNSIEVNLFQFNRKWSITHRKFSFLYQNNRIEQI